MGCVKSKCPCVSRAAKANDSGYPMTSPASSAVQTPDEPKPSFRSLYDLSYDKLGEGASTTVFAATHKETYVRVAVKCFAKAEMQLEDEDDLCREVDILRGLSHPDIIRFVDFFDEPNYYFLVTELVEGGELFDRLVQKEVYSERDAQQLVRALLGVVQYLHQRNIVHQDLKVHVMLTCQDETTHSLENILLVTSDDDTTIKLCDFGFAQYDTDNQLSQKWGSPDYLAPEIITQPTYGRQVDIWSAGVITFILLSGCAPFVGDTNAELLAAIQLGKIHFQPEYWHDVSPAAQSFVRRMLVVDPNERATVDDLLQDPWLARPASSASFKSTIEELRRLNARKKFKSAVKTVQAAVAFRASLHGRPTALSEATTDTSDV
ncbi:Aste57867_17171 [Aphanomyces stellatus]|uniref:Aste57867_17171 protein n=1 Tax=Aphanomyces stellatus TaxID=120398 RepID=A0A485L786_9STRA|nr:hypothetical protein As57867_017112 [Aphanomyces stellatus]VFT93928.1 Aste57867_17171 [Aphanomyces stellatus]